jgi:hypothetical protein
MSSKIVSLTQQLSELRYLKHQISDTLFNNRVPTSLTHALATYSLVAQPYESLTKRIISMTQPDDEEALALSNLSRETDDVFSSFKIDFLTHYPSAPIEYGEPCVKPIRGWHTRERAMKQFEGLCKSHAGLREIRGDGNCFFTSIAVLYLESLCSTRNFISALDYFEGNEPVVDTLLQLNDRPEQLETFLSNNQKMLPFVQHFRAKAAAFITAHPDTFPDPSEASRIKKMGECADHQALLALALSLQFPFRLLDLDKSGALTEHTFPSTSHPEVTLCRSDNHYYILCKNIPQPKKPLLDRAISHLERDLLERAQMDLGCLFDKHPAMAGEIYGTMYWYHRELGKLGHRIDDTEYGAKAFNGDPDFNATNAERIEVIRRVQTKQLVRALLDAVERNDLSAIRNLDDQLHKLNPDRRGRLHGCIYELARKQNISTNHYEFGRVALRNEDGFSVPTGLKLEALRRLLTEMTN